MPNTQLISSQPNIAIIGAGPAGLMAAEVIANAGYPVDIFDAMPSVARKFLLAGVGGMNITHAEEYSAFVARYGAAQDDLKPILDNFPPEKLRAWIHQLGIETFVGTSLRVFPKDMKAAPLLRAWLHRLRGQGVKFHSRHKWVGWQNNSPQQGWQFQTPDELQTKHFAATVLALGGASWQKLGSDGQWCNPLKAANITVAPLQPSNCGFELQWSRYIKERFAGTPLKNVQLSLTDVNGKFWQKTGEFVISEYGLEGSLIYALSAPLRELIANDTKVSLWLDWLPQYTEDQIAAKLTGSRKGVSLPNLLKKSLKLPPVAISLLKEYWPDLNSNDHRAIASGLKKMLLQPHATRPIDEAISSAGGICWSEVNNNLMLQQLPGVFVAGEMLDWEAPTGGYLLSGCFATGQKAGAGVVSWIKNKSPVG